MSEKKSAIRLNRLTIKNYKKIDSLEIDFPRPLMKGDADILVFGSKNGGGKTSVLECCALTIFAAIKIQANPLTHDFGLRWNTLLDDKETSNLLVKAGQLEALIKAEFEQNEKKCILFFTINRNGFYQGRLEGDTTIHFSERNSIQSHSNGALLNSLLAFSNEPLISPPLIYFNSYRKVQELNPTLGMIGNNAMDNSISSFKKEVIAALMGEKGLFEETQQDDFELILTKANELCRRYCGGEISQLQKLPDNTMVIRVKQKDGFSFHFDGLSSGQKEMIATLFLIWKNTKDQPSIVLIDEPELHLNAEWQSDFVRQLHKLAPNNQYILATHSETIFRSVDRNHRGLLDSNENGVK